MKSFQGWYRVAWIDEYSRHQFCIFYRAENAIALIQYFVNESDVHIFKLETI